MSAFPRSEVTSTTSYDGKIRFATDGQMQMHLTTKDLTVSFKNSEVINHVERSHIAFRTDDMEAFKASLNQHSIPYSDYRTAFAKEWHQVFFHDPEDNVIEVHQAVVFKGDRSWAGRNDKLDKVLETKTHLRYR